MVGSEHVSERFRRLPALYQKPDGSEWGGQDLQGNDVVLKGGSAPGNQSSADVVYGDEGNDTIDVRDVGPGMAPDEVRCGPGKKDRVTHDKGVDTVARDCEIKKTGP